MTTDLEKLRRALETMNADDRAVFERARFDGFSYDMIAQQLEIDLEEVEMRLGAALRHLHDALEQ